MMKIPFRIYIHKEGWKLLSSVALGLITINLLLFFLAGGITFSISLVISSVLFLFFTNFFRSPRRFYQQSHPGDIVSPADGKVVVIEPVYENLLLKERRLQVSIFMSVTDVHANWYPLAGKVIHYSHRSGNYHAAWLPKASSENERSSVIIRAAYNQQTVLVRQIAGALARRIVTYAHTGKRCKLNEHLGFIKFGSRVDLFFPLDSVDMLVEQGAHVKGNKTVIARFKDKERNETV
jgi:phosphatidylserine decarboxylase